MLVLLGFILVVVGAALRSTGMIALGTLIAGAILALNYVKSRVGDNQ